MTSYVVLIFFFVLLLLLSNRRGKEPDLKSKSNRFGKISETLKGHKVRSKGEKRIADWLFSHNIKYKYEPKLSKFIPDFFLPEHGVIIEYYGLADAPGNIGVKYRNKINHKRQYFSSLSVRFLELYQEDLSRLDIIIPQALKTVT